MQNLCQRWQAIEIQNLTSLGMKISDPLTVKADIGPSISTDSQGFAELIQGFPERG